MAADPKPTPEFSIASRVLAIFLTMPPPRRPAELHRVLIDYRYEGVIDFDVPKQGTIRTWLTRYDWASAALEYDREVQRQVVKRTAEQAAVAVCDHAAELEEFAAVAIPTARLKVLEGGPGELIHAATTALRQAGFMRGGPSSRVELVGDAAKTERQRELDAFDQYLDVTDSAAPAPAPAPALPAPAAKTNGANGANGHGADMGATPKRPPTEDVG